MNFGAVADDYYQRADSEILVVIQTEHIAAVEIADEIYAVPGIDAIFVGPNDLAASLRLADGTPPSPRRMEEVLTQIREAAARHSVPCGLHVTTIEQARRRVAEGWQFIAVGSELKLMLDGASDLARHVHPELAAGELAKY